MLTGCWARRGRGDEVFEQLVLARIIEPVNKAGCLKMPGGPSIGCNVLVAHPRYWRLTPAVAGLLLPGLIDCPDHQAALAFPAPCRLLQPSHGERADHLGVSANPGSAQQLRCAGSGPQRLVQPGHRALPAPGVSFISVVGCGTPGIERDPAKPTPADRGH